MLPAFPWILGRQCGDGRDCAMALPYRDILGKIEAIALHGQS
jgi:hypothetical protein